MAAAAAGARSGGGGATATSATTTTSASRYVKAAETMACVSSRAPVVAAARPLPLMPGADVDDDDDAGPAPTQVTIVYGGRVLVLDAVPADRAAELLQVAAAARGANKMPRPMSAADVPMAREASLQRFMEKRKGRIAARAAPYLRPDARGDRHDELTLAL